jgi:YbbR domain-containing protein
MIQIISLLRRNLFYKLFALGAAILFYVIASYQQNPRANDHEEVYIQPEIIGLPESLVVRVPPAAFTVDLTGSSALVKAFQAQPSKALVDANSAQAGTVSLPLNYVQPGGPGQQLVINGPKSSLVTLEARQYETMPVQVVYHDDSPAGYTVEPPQASSKTVKVSGLAEEVKRVVRVVAEFENTENATQGASTEQMVALRAEDAKRQTVNTVRLEPGRVLVRMVMRKTTARKKLLLSADIKGEVAPGFTLDQYAFTPSMVEVEGEEARLETLSSLSLPVDVTNLQENKTLDVPEVPMRSALPGVRILNNTPIKVSLTVHSLRKKSAEKK